MARRVLRFALLLACGCARDADVEGPTTRSLRQPVMMPLGGDATQGSRFGHALAVGDFNHDGVYDLAVGAPGTSPGGAVYVYIGPLSATALAAASRSLVSSYVDAGFGTALTVGDFNGDHIDDLAVGAPDFLGGSAVVYYGHGGTGFLTGLDTLDVEVVDLTAALGSALVAVPHPDAGDDLWVGAPNHADGGLVRTYAGITTAIVVNTLTANGGRFGASLAVADFAHTGAPQVAVGAPLEAPSGAVHAFDARGMPLLQFPPKPTAALDFGTALAVVQDQPYLVVGATGPGSPSAVTVNSVNAGQIGTFTFAFDAGMDVGRSITGWNAADNGELVVAGAPGAGQVMLMRPSGSSSSAMPVPGRDPAEHFGCAVEGHHDVTGDGHPDLVVGAEQFGGTGTVFIFPGADSTAMGGGGGGGSGGGGGLGVAGGTAGFGGGGGGGGLGVAGGMAGFGGGGGGGGSGVAGGMAGFGGGGGGGGGFASYGGGSAGGGGGSAMLGGGPSGGSGGMGGAAGGTGDAGVDPGPPGVLQFQTSACGCTTGDGGALFLLGGLALRRRRR